MNDRATKNASFPLVLMRNFGSVMTGTLAFMVLLNAIGVWRAGDRFLAEVKSFFTAAPPSANVEPSNLIIHQVRNASELTTAVFAMETVVPAHKDRTVGKLVVGKTSLLYTAYGEVRAGVDLSELTASNLRTANNTVYLQLPPPKILDTKLDVNRSEVYNYDRGFLNLGPDAAAELQTLAQRETLAKIVRNACSQGVLENANERAELVVSKILSTAGYSDVRVQTTPPDLQACQAAAVGV